MTDDNERDAEGRHPGAAAWSGDLAGASTAALESHESGLRSHIGNLFVKYEGQKPAGRQWRPRTDAELRDAVEQRDDVAVGGKTRQRHGEKHEQDRSDRENVEFWRSER